MPVTAYLEKQLKKENIEIKSDLTVDGLVNAIANEFKGGNG